ncbi:MAG: hypothetical protein ACPF95_04850 [Flavobacteriaceae bacterium]
MRILILIAILVGVYFAITVLLKWLLEWIFKADKNTSEFHEKSETQQEIEDFIEGKR